MSLFRKIFSKNNSNVLRKKSEDSYWSRLPVPRPVASTQRQIPLGNYFLEKNLGSLQQARPPRKAQVWQATTQSGEPCFLGLIELGAENRSWLEQRLGNVQVKKWSTIRTKGVLRKWGHKVDVLSFEAVLADRYLLKKCVVADAMQETYEAYDIQNNTMVYCTVYLPNSISLPSNFSIRPSIQSVDVNTYPIQILELLNEGMAQPIGMFASYRFKVPGLYYAIVRYVPAISFSHFAKTWRGNVTTDYLGRILSEIGTCFHTLAQQNSFHGNIRPQTIWIGIEGENKGRVFLNGYSIQTSEDEYSSASLILQNSATQGYPFYLAPEQLSHQNVNICADYFALGIILYELISARRLFRNTNQREMLQRIEQWKLPKNLKLPKQFIWTEPFLKTMLHPNPMHREIQWDLFLEEFKKRSQEKCLEDADIKFVDLEEKEEVEKEEVEKEILWEEMDSMEGFHEGEWEEMTSPNVPKEKVSIFQTLVSSFIGKPKNMIPEKERATDKKFEEDWVILENEYQDIEEIEDEDVYTAPKQIIQKEESTLNQEELQQELAQLFEQEELPKSRESFPKTIAKVGKIKDSQTKFIDGNDEHKKEPTIQEKIQHLMEVNFGSTRPAISMVQDEQQNILEESAEDKEKITKTPSLKQISTQKLNEKFGKENIEVASEKRKEKIVADTIPNKTIEKAQPKIHEIDEKIQPKIYAMDEKIQPKIYEIDKKIQTKIHEIDEMDEMEAWEEWEELEELPELKEVKDVKDVRPIPKETSIKAEIVNTISKEEIIQKVDEKVTIEEVQDFDFEELEKFKRSETAFLEQQKREKKKPEINFDESMHEGKMPVGFESEGEFEWEKEFESVKKSLDQWDDSDEEEII